MLSGAACCATTNVRGWFLYFYGAWAFNYKTNFHNTSTKTLFTNKFVPPRFGLPWTTNFYGANAAAGATPDWKPVQQVFGFDGSAMPGGVIRFNMPRADLHVTVGGVEVKPGLALGGWAALASMAKGGAMIMGDLVLTADEVPPVTNALMDGGVEVTAIHNHLLGESPQILYLHMGGHGDPVKMGQAVVKAVALTKTHSDARPW